MGWGTGGRRGGGASEVRLNTVQRYVDKAHSNRPDVAELWDMEDSRDRVDSVGDSVSRCSGKGGCAPGAKELARDGERIGK